MEKHRYTVSAILSAEVAAARIEGILRTDAALGRLWRSSMSLVEAAASVGLEDVRLTEAAIIMKLTRSLTTDIDARGADLANRLMRIMKRPGDIQADPVRSMRRIESAAAPIGIAAEHDQRPDDTEIMAMRDSAERFRHSPILSGLVASATYAMLSHRLSPAAERLVFMEYEGNARRLWQSTVHKDGFDDPQFMTAYADWIVAPSTALTHQGFRIWSPLRESSLVDFIHLVARQLSRELGTLGIMREELSRLRQMKSSGRGRSRISDLVDLIELNPILSSSLVIDRLAVTRKTALALIGECEAAGVLVNFTGRRVARLWATPSFAARMVHDARDGRRPGRTRPAGPAPDKTDREHLGGGGELPEFDEDRLNRVLDELSQAMSGMDEVLGQIGRRSRELRGED